MLVQNPGMRPSAAKLLKHKRIRFATERQTFLMRKSKLEERELAFQDAIRNKDAEIYSLCQREMELIQALNKLKEDKDAEIQSLNWKIHHYQRREAEMYEIIQSKQKETKDAFLRRETELLEALEQRDEVMRFTRGRLEALVKCSRSAELEDYKTARSLLEEVTDILYPQAVSPMREVVLTATGEVLRTPSPRKDNFEQAECCSESRVRNFEDFGGERAKSQDRHNRNRPQVTSVEDVDSKRSLSRRHPNYSTVPDLKLQLEWHRQHAIKDRNVRLPSHARVWVQSVNKEQIQFTQFSTVTGCQMRKRD
ncbi:hypothetical protein B0H14DRAFT_3149461 [Mycena olivaceomarginata]|nr:hypothetical protein B0H14DRAFT_3149461 [Mycena olivaceomarginata]